MRKIDKQSALRAIPRAVLRLLPIGALFLPLGTLNINLGGLGDILGGLGGLLGGLGGGNGSGASYNIVKLIKALTNGEDSELFKKLMAEEFMATSRAWVIAVAVGLVLCVLAALAGLAFIFAKKTKPLMACALVYTGGALSGIFALLAFTQFNQALAEAWNNIASAALNYGAYLLAAAMLLNLVVCLLQWRSVREAERLTALARQQKKKK